MPQTTTCQRGCLSCKGLQGAGSACWPTRITDGIPGEGSGAEEGRVPLEGEGVATQVSFHFVILILATIDNHSE